MKLQTPKGTRDFLQEKAKLLENVIEIIKEVFRKYGFSPLYTPAFEYFSLLSKKGSGGIKDEIYYFKDKSKRELGLRFDLTVPLARVIASNPNLTKPFKTYAIGKVWRYDNPQKLRYREFWQTDIDIIGSNSIEADVECLAAACECFKKLGIKDFYIRINNRKLLQNIFEDSVEKSKITEAFRIIDKLDKIGFKKVKEELKKEKINSDILKIIKVSGSNKEILGKLKKKYEKNKGIEELEKLLRIAKEFGIEKKIKIDLSLVRGLDYYTGIVSEIMIKGMNVSFGGGGRYDNLIGLYGKRTPATGISLGLDRILDLVDIKIERKKYFIASVGDVKKQVIKICQELRKNDISTEFDLMNRNLRKQLDYANSQNFPFVIIVGEKELKKKSVLLRNMKTGKEKIIEIKNLKEL